MTHSTEENVPTRLTIAHLIFLLNQHKDRLLEKHLKPFDITGPQFRVLMLVICEQVDTPSALTRILSIDSGAMTRMLDRLEQRGLLARERCPNDRRQVRLKPTQEGIEFSQEVRGITGDLLSELTAELSTGDLTELERIIRKILAPTGILDDPYKASDR